MSNPKQEAQRGVILLESVLALGALAVSLIVMLGVLLSLKAEQVAVRNRLTVESEIAALLEDVNAVASLVAQAAGPDGSQQP